MHRLAGIVLAGGASRRMGRDKASLDWHGLPLVVRAAGLLRRAVDGPVIVVAAPGQALPALPPGVEVARDAEPGLGPLAGLAAGLEALAGRSSAAFATGTDAPLLHPLLVRRVAALLGDAPAIVPLVRGRTQQLASVLGPGALAAARSLLADGERRLGALVERLDARLVDEEALLADPLLRAVDPRLDGIRSLDRVEDYERALAQPAPTVDLGVGPTATVMSAWTLGAGGYAPGTRFVVDGRDWAGADVPLVERDRLVVAEREVVVRLAEGPAT